ncbi:MAG: YidC/Oxa1 family insertase periplasmic-domain containing protein [Gemmataceae bacterium]
MRQNAFNVVVFIIISTLFLGGMYYFFPPPAPPVPPPLKPAKEPAAALGGFASVSVSPHDSLKSLPAKTPEPSAPAAKVEKPQVVPPKPAAPAEPHRLIAMGNDHFKKKILLNTQGAGVQQVVLNHFHEADRVGKQVSDPDGQPRQLHLIPGFLKARPAKVTEAPPHVELEPGLVKDKRILSEPSYTMFHYPKKGDPAYREPIKADAVNGIQESDPTKYPLPDLGVKTWKVVKEDCPENGPQTVVFETELDAPHYLKIRKTFTLDPSEYHLGFTVDIEPLPARQKGAPEFQYQIAGPRGLPIEGEWYTQTFRNAYIGKQDLANASRFYRDIQDSSSVNVAFGGDAIPKAGTRLIYASVGTQYFASALAVDVRKESGSPWSYVRSTREDFTSTPPPLPQFEDITIRAVSEPLELIDGKPVSQHFIIYDGPIKIQLLSQLRGDQAVKDELVSFYTDQLGLNTMTDYHSPYFFGRVSNALYWTQAIIFFTNIMHRVLGFLHSIVPIWGLDIILLTVMVRLSLMYFSRKQQVIGAKSQAKMASLQPEIDRLKKKFENDQQAFNQAKTKLFLEHGVLNPKAQLAGCGLLLLQMPIFMGLYFCLQESVFFRLSPFLWIKNLSAPDMLFSWTESIPVISDPEFRTGMLSFLYLGPFFNLLPVISVTLMFIHTKLTMPPATDEMQEQQQKMMKFMMLFMGLFFYKIAAGLCLYFICSTAWGLTERKLIPKPKVEPYNPAAAPANNVVGKNGVPAKKTGFFARLMEKVEEAQKLADQQRQIRNDPKDAKDRDKKKKK